MHNCDSLDPLVTPFVHGDLPDADRSGVEDPLPVCPPCHSRVTAERAVHDLLRARRATLCRTQAPDALHLRCAELVHASLEGNAKNAETAKIRDGHRQQNVERENLQNLQNLQNPNLATPNLSTQNLSTQNLS